MAAKRGGPAGRSQGTTRMRALVLQYASAQITGLQHAVYLENASDAEV